MTHFDIVDAPARIPRGRRMANPEISALCAALATLPEGKAIPVSAAMFGWAALKDNQIQSQLMNALRRRGVVATTFHKDGVLHVMRRKTEQVPA